MELIDRAKVLAKIYEFQSKFNETGDSHERVAYASAEHCMIVVKATPVIEAEPVRHGQWIEAGEVCGIDKYKCSLCGGEVGGLLDNTKYCCFCGAKMDGGAENG